MLWLIIIDYSEFMKRLYISNKKHSSISLHNLVYDNLIYNLIIDVGDWLPVSRIDCDHIISHQNRPKRYKADSFTDLVFPLLSDNNSQVGKFSIKAKNTKKTKQNLLDSFFK